MTREPDRGGSDPARAPTGIYRRGNSSPATALFSGSRQLAGAALRSFIRVLTVDCRRPWFCSFPKGATATTAACAARGVAGEKLRTLPQLIAGVSPHPAIKAGRIKPNPLIPRCGQPPFQVSSMVARVRSRAVGCKGARAVAPENDRASILSC